VVSSPPGSLVQRARWYTALGLAAVFFSPAPAEARYLPQDDTPPLVSYSIDGIVGTNGWYRGGSSGAFIVVHWSVSDPDSPITSTVGCEPAVRVNDPNTGTTLTCTASSDGGTTSVTTKTLKVDATAPTGVTASASRSPDHNGWFNASVGISWSGSDPTSGIGSCSSVTYTGPDSATANATGTCTDNAGNTSAAASFPFKFDDTLPSVSATPARGPDHAGWYNHALGITWSGNDATSGIDPSSCTSMTYSSPASANGSASGSCSDNAGNTRQVSFPLSYDSTAPTSVTASASRSPDHNAWFNASVGISWSGSDPTSGIDSCSSITYTGPDSASASASGTCTDKAGNTSAATSFPFKFDDTLPSVSATPTRGPDHGGWYNHALGVTWSGTDTTSGIDSSSCTSLTYSAPDVANGSTSGSCSDNAGNTRQVSFPLSYDSTAPTGVSASAARSADHSGWFNASVGIGWSGSDATSGIASCSSITYSGPDSASASVNGTCADNAGNTSAAKSFSFKYDDTPPTVTAAASRSPDDNGWYNQPVGISWSGTDATSGIASCAAPVTYSGPDTKNASSVGSCTDAAGNAGTPAPFSIKYDSTPPVATAAPARGPDANGWYNHGLTISWTSSDPVSGIASCSSTTYAAPDSGSVSPSGTCTDGAGNTSAAVPFSFRFDSTPPTGVAVAAARPPDHGGWYNRPFSANWSGFDALSGIASCTTATYGGPTNTGTALSGSCTDQAGNTSGSVGYGFKYDSTPPVLDGLSLTPRDDAVTLRWRASGANGFTVNRKPGLGTAASSVVYDGPASTFADRRVDNYTRYTYVVTAEDAAGNELARSAAAMPMPMLYAPRPGARVSPGSAPLFAWRHLRSARYYNVQLWLTGRAVGSWWPERPRLKMSARWRFGGSGHTLVAGSYTWYVWPGRGPRRNGRYGPLLGKSTFVVG